jgi:hypothetical protein
MRQQAEVGIEEVQRVFGARAAGDEDDAEAAERATSRARPGMASGPSYVE